MSFFSFCLSLPFFMAISFMYGGGRNKGYYFTPKILFYCTEQQVHKRHICLGFAFVVLYLCFYYFFFRKTKYGKTSRLGKRNDDAHVKKKFACLFLHLLPIQLGHLQVLWLENAKSTKILEAGVKII